MNKLPKYCAWQVWDNTRPPNFLWVLNCRNVNLTIKDTLVTYSPRKVCSFDFCPYCAGRIKIFLMVNNIAYCTWEFYWYPKGPHLIDTYCRNSFWLFTPQLYNDIIYPYCAKQIHYFNFTVDKERNIIYERRRI